MYHLLRIIAANPYQIDVSKLPHVTADSARLQLFLTVVFMVIGAICLLFVTIGGFRYVASQGDPKAAALAKSTILYALIGVAVCISAVAIVNFVLGAV